MHTLDAMGITVWRQRGTDSQVSPTPPRVCCIAQKAYADETLLSNILKAIECPLHQAQIFWVDNPEELAEQTWPQVPTIVFGEALYSHTPESAIRTVTLTELGNNISAKKSLWQALKTLS